MLNTNRKKVYFKQKNTLFESAIAQVSEGAEVALF